MTAQIKTLPGAVVCSGISVRTTNIAETSHDTAKLGRLWQKFYQNHVSHLAEDEDIYGIYHNYESDDVGAFDVVASWKLPTETSSPADSDDSDEDRDSDSANVNNNNSHHADNTVTVSIPAGKYMVFSEQGNMPNTVMNAWEKAWTYFNTPGCEHTRTYDVDFEHYIDGNLEYGQVDLYIGIE